MKYLTFILILLIAFLTINKAWSKCINGDCLNSNSTYVFPNGAVYKGEFRNGKFHGHGTYTELDGSKYTNKYIGEYIGEFKNGQINGDATYNGIDGTKYIGKFKNSKFHGQGTLIEPDGTKYIGEFKNGYFHGNGIRTSAKGYISKGIFRKGVFQGKDNIRRFFYNSLTLIIVWIVYWIICTYPKLTIMGNILITIGIMAFMHIAYSFIINFNEITFWFFCKRLIFETFWPIAGGMWLRKVDIPTPTPLDPDENAEQCPDCNGKGRIKTGEKTDYDSFSPKKTCSSCGGTGRRDVTYYPPHGQYNEYTFPREYKKCSLCNGTGWVQGTEIILTNPCTVSVYQRCHTCRGFGSLGEHVKRDAEIESNASCKIFVTLLMFVYITYYSWHYSLLYKLTL